MPTKSLCNTVTEISQDIEIYGIVGSPVPGSRYYRDYCYLCKEPIRVDIDMIGKPNTCSFCQPAYRGVPGVTEAEKAFWIRSTWDDVEVISA